MKLVLLSSNYPPHFEGGTERVVRAQARELAALGHEVSIVAGAEFLHRGEDVERTEVDGLPVAFIPRLDSEHFDIDYARPRIVDLVLKETDGADWVHVHHWFPTGVELVRPLSQHHSVAITFHDLFATCPRFFRSSVVAGLGCPDRGDFEPCLECVASDIPDGRSEDQLRSNFVARARAFDAEVRAANCLIAPSQSHARRVAQLFGLKREQLEVVQHGLCESIERAPRQSTWDGSRPLRVLHPGHRTSSKGTRDLVEALAALPAGQVELVLAGSEVEAGFDAELAKAAAGLKLQLRPKYAQSELGELFGSADLVALPSRAIESYGLVLDEAHATGLPVWVSDRGALPERVNGAGRVLPAEDPGAWTKAFEELLREPAEYARELAALPETMPTAEQAAIRLTELYSAHTSRSEKNGKNSTNEKT